MRDPYNTGSELDHRLEAVIDAHCAETTKESSTPTSGLQAFIDRQTISQEIANITPEKVAHVDLREELVKEQMDGIIEGRRAALADFHEAVKSAAAAETVTPEKVATDLIRQGVDPQEAARRALA